MPVMSMNFTPAAIAIGEAIANLPDIPIVEHKRFPAPDFYQDIVFTPGMIANLVRWDGISLDGSNGFNVPRGFRYELRILSDKYGTSDPDLNPDGLSAYVLAQMNVLTASGAMYEKLEADRSLGGLVIGTNIISSFTGDLVDPEAGQEYYGHEVIFETTNLI